MSLNIKQFNVLNTTSGKMPITGRLTSSVLSTILSYNTIRTGTTENVTVPGTPVAITSGALFNNAHMSTSFIKIVRSTFVNSSIDTVYVPDGFIRISYLKGICDFKNTILYGFTPFPNETLNNITFNVAFASSLSQTEGDYVDVALPNIPGDLYLVIILLVNVWSTRTIVSGNRCSIDSTNAKYNYCIKPSLSVNDMINSHFIVIQGKNTNQGIFSHIVLGIEDDIFAFSDKDYNDFQIGIGSRSILSAQVNDNSLS